MSTLKNIFFILMAMVLLAACVQQPAAEPVAQVEEPAAEEAAVEEPAAEEAAAEKLTYCYITPGPDTWYKRDVEGFEYGASLDNVEVIVVNSDYDVEKELQNIEFCINQGVDGISVFSFNENGARLAAQKGQEAGIPVVATDSVGSVQAAGQDIVAEIDFDWSAIGEATAEWMAENHPGKDFVHITGNFESIPMIKINEAILNKSEELGQNKRLDIREGEFNPEVAVKVAEDFLQSGLDFEIIYVADEDTGAAVIRMLKDEGVLNNPYIVMSENGSTAGLPLIKNGELAYTVSSSPGWEGYIAYLALHNNVIGTSDEINQQIYLPIMEITEDNIDDPLSVVPWEITPDIYEQLTAKYYPDLLKYRGGAMEPAAEEAAVEEPAAEEVVAEKLTYCYITPGPDTWYKRDVEGFEYGASLDGVEVIVVNSDYDVEKELQNIEFCINQGVDGISVFSFNENGARLAAQKGQEAGIPVVATDSVGSVQASGQDIVAEIDFDWSAIGEATAEWMAENHPGKDFVHITGNFESIPMIKINEAILNKSEELGQNKRLDIREGEFNPEVAVKVAEDFLQSGLDFEIIYVADEDTGAAVIRMLKDEGVLNNPYIVMSENGSTAGLPLIKNGELAYTVSSSPGWEGYIAYLALHNNVIGTSDEINQQIYLPIMEITEENIDDPLSVVPWEITPDIYEQLTIKYYPELLEYRQ